MTSYHLSINVDLTDAEAQRLGASLRVSEEALPEGLERLARAATEEWLDQALARRLPPRIKDMREVRLLHYAMHVSGGRLPKPEQISDLFHLTATEARTLHRNTRTRYAFELRQGVLDALGDTLKSGTWVEASAGAKGFVRVQMDDALFEFAELQMLSGENASAPRIMKDDNYGAFRVPLVSLRLLCRASGVDYDEVVASARARS